MFSLTPDFNLVFLLPETLWLPPLIILVDILRHNPYIISHPSKMYSSLEIWIYAQYCATIIATFRMFLSSLEEASCSPSHQLPVLTPIVPASRQSLTYFLHLWVCLLCMLHGNVASQYVHLCVWLLSLSEITSRLTMLRHMSVLTPFHVWTLFCWVDAFKSLCSAADGHVGWSGCCESCCSVHVATRSGVSVCFYLFRSGIDFSSVVNCMFSFWRNCEIIFQSECTVLPSSPHLICPLPLAYSHLGSISKDSYFIEKKRTISKVRIKLPEYLRQGQG